MAELADALDLGSSTERCRGSSPRSRTNEQQPHTFLISKVKLKNDINSTDRKKSSAVKKIALEISLLSDNIDPSYTFRFWPA